MGGPAETTSVSIQDAMGCAHDAERRRLMSELERRLAQQSAVAELGAVALRSSALEPLIERAVEVARTTFGAAAATFWAPTDDPAELRLVAAAGAPVPAAGTVI